jgi:hypothetical protein
MCHGLHDKSNLIGTRRPEMCAVILCSGRNSVGIGRSPPLRVKAGRGLRMAVVESIQCVIDGFI